ncbi:MAG: MFS transporter [Planctomycetes bacterium]|nr:MFS transporter [Planctomycetota bacterium]
MTKKLASQPHEALAQGIAFGDYRVRIFVVTWLAYAGFYFCRKNFSVAMPLLKEELQFNDDHFKWILFVFSLSYMLGQFLAGVLSDRYGSRLIVGLGMIVAVLANGFMGLSGTPFLFLLLGAVSGGAQSTGWSGTLKNMAPWYARSERGVVMAWWATCYVLGAFLATQFAAWCISSNAPFDAWGWRRVFWMPAAVLAGITLLYVLLTRNSPSDVGLPELDEIHPNEIDQDETGDPQAANESGGLADILEVLGHSAVWITGAMYFLLKLTRYAILFWAPLFLVERVGLDNVAAGVASSWYELVGFLGVVFAGYVSDKMFSAKRFPVGSLMLLGLAVASYLVPTLVAWGQYGPALALSLMGFMTYGPDTLMTGAGAMDIGTPRRAATAAGVINGMGSCGQLLSPFVVTYMKNAYGWDSIFYLFVGCALLGAVLLATKWNYGGRASGG